jgi:trehalose-6-phosphatase
MTEFQASIRSAVQTRRQGRFLLILLDYDGTLVEIAPHPELARPTPELLEVPGRLVSQADRKEMVVSGRPLRDLEELLPVPGLNLPGSHGGEIFIAGQPCALPWKRVGGTVSGSWKVRLDWHLGQRYRRVLIILFDFLHGC